MRPFIKGSDSHFDLQVGMFIAFDEIEFIGGEPAGTVLDYFIEIVEHIVFNFETEGTKLGLLK